MRSLRTIKAGVPYPPEIRAALGFPPGTCEDCYFGVNYSLFKKPMTSLLVAVFAEATLELIVSEAPSWNEEAAHEILMRAIKDTVVRIHRRTVYEKH